MAPTLIRLAQQLNGMDLPDGALVRRFVESRDEAAFAELVRRHGPAVFGVCRRALGDHQLAEDAFQAVFVILARKAETIRPPDAVGGWLFGVARHVAARAVTMRKRQRKERSSGAVPECAIAAIEPDDDSAILESEIAKLPEGLRAAVVLCEIEGLSRAQGATRLGIAEGTLSSRLASARKRLALRLRAHGVVPLLAFGTLPVIPPELSAAAIHSAANAANLAPTVTKLASEALHMILFSKLKLAAVGVVGAFAMMAEFGGGQAVESMAVPPVARKRNAPVPKQDTLKLTAEAKPEKAEIMLGEPTYLSFEVANKSDKNWRLQVGGDYRNRFGRPESFTVEAVGPDGKAVPQPDAGMSMGGLTYAHPLPAEGVHAFSLFLPHWATFEKPGKYKLTIRRKLVLIPVEGTDAFPDKASSVYLSATATITVVPPDPTKFGTLIAALSATMADPKSPDRNRAETMLAEIRDVRVIPHFVTLAGLPRPEARMHAGDVLGRFDTDEAFAALKKLLGTTAADLRGSATTVELEEHSAAAVRHSAVGAFGKCPHPDALPLFWSHADDEYYGTRITVLHRAAEVKSVKARAIIEKMTTDKNEIVRDEAIRYKKELMKEDE